MIRIKPIKDGKIGTLRQWDKGRQMIIIPKEGYTVDEAHFFNGTTEKALVSKVKEENGQMLASIPNMFLQSSNRIEVYLVTIKDEVEATIESDSFHVIERPMPDDYVHSEEEIYSYKALEKRVEALEKNGTGGINVITDSELSKESTNPVQNQAVAKEFASYSGTVEITGGEPTKEKTVLTLDPNAEDVYIYTADEVDAMFGSYVTDVAAMIGGIEE